MYNPGDLKVTIPGIGNLNRDKTIKATDIAADEYGAKEYKRDWSYKYDATTDTYTFYNNKTIEKGETFNGSFELLWQFNSRNSKSGYNQKLQATLNDEEKTVLSQELSLNYTSKKDTFYIEKTAKSIISADGLSRFVENGKKVTDYAWVQYTFRYNVKELNAKWGNKFVKNLSIRLKIDFPNMKGFSITNLKYMRTYYLECQKDIMEALPTEEDLNLYIDIDENEEKNN